ncbi:sigma factor-like helix-turn-helix DNA-binding protein [Catenulispora sp. GAS73]|uniref:sigma factor-like helix-turn-helix DNA-binding protein n=1 Tax=Catenulispora sp. GAS73 TaxID=3156269 RepID=UPI0035187253
MLPARQRPVFMLAVDGLDPAAISKTLHITSDHARVHLHHAKKAAAGSGHRNIRTAARFSGSCGCGLGRRRSAAVPAGQLACVVTDAAQRGPRPRRSGGCGPVVRAGGPGPRRL